MGKFIDITEQRFGRLIAIKRIGTKSGHALWLCKCDCGNESEVDANSLRRNKTSSCGCLQKEQIAARSQAAGKARGRQLTKHGMTGTRLYNIWKAMRERCNNSNDRYFGDYGGRGIRVCNEWDNYSAFHQWAMENGYVPTAPFGLCTIDRIDFNGHYNPQNCRWVDAKTQANNRRKRRRNEVLV